jgi:hypothetical protein
MPDATQPEQEVLTRLNLLLTIVNKQDLFRASLGNLLTFAHRLLDVEQTASWTGIPPASADNKKSGRSKRYNLPPAREDVN